MITTGRIFLRMGKDLRKKFEEKIKLNKFFLKNPAVNDVMWINLVQQNRSQTRIWCILIASWITQSTSTHSDYVIPTGFHLQQCSHERPLMLRCL